MSARESDGLFGIEGLPFKIRFVRDPNGNVTHFVVLADGQEMGRGQKVKLAGWDETLLEGAGFHSLSVAGLKAPPFPASRKKPLAALHSVQPRHSHVPPD
jgi:hypothetical protein